MMTVKQVASFTGVSARTLQFYDEIGLLKATGRTDAGYRLYDEKALEKLQQILFFKELDFPLKEIKVILEHPTFNLETTLKKQRELLQIKRNRLNALLELLDKRIGGESKMNFSEFDMTMYFHALADFKRTHAKEIVQQLDTLKYFDEMVAEMKSHEDEIAPMAVKQYGSIERFTKAMEQNFEKFCSIGPAVTPAEASIQIQETDVMMKKLTGNLSKNPASPAVQEQIRALISLANESNQGLDMGENYWPFMAELYKTNPAFIEATDRKYGDGASKFISQAIRAYLDRT